MPEPAERRFEWRRGDVEIVPPTDPPKGVDEFRHDELGRVLVDPDHNPTTQLPEK